MRATPGRRSPPGPGSSSLVEPPLLLLAFFLQLRAPGGNPSRSDPLPGPSASCSSLQGALLLALGAVLFAVLSTSRDWPWQLTELTGRAIAAWLVAVGGLLAAMAWEGDRSRIRLGPTCSSPWLCFRRSRWRGSARGSTFSAEAMIYLASLASLGATAAWGWRISTGEAVRGFLDRSLGSGSWPGSTSSSMSGMWRHPPSAVFEVLGDAGTYPEWWKPVYHRRQGGGSPGVGRIVHQHFRGPLPYTLEDSGRDRPLRTPSDNRVTCGRRPFRTAVWTITPRNGGSHVRFDWTTTADRPLLRYLSPLLRPLFRWNHNWAAKRAMEGPRALRPKPERIRNVPSSARDHPRSRLRRQESPPNGGLPWWYRER